MKNPRYIEDGGDRDRELDALRSVALQCTNASRVRDLINGKIFTGELCWTTDHRRLWVGGRFIGPKIWHGEVSSESEMLALWTDTPTGRAANRGDKVFRADTQTIWECIYQHATDPVGTLLAHWVEYQRSSGTAGLSLVPMSNRSATDPAFLFNSAGEPLLALVDPSTIS